MSGSLRRSKDGIVEDEARAAIVLAGAQVELEPGGAARDVASGEAKEAADAVVGVEAGAVGDAPQAAFFEIDEDVAVADAVCGRRGARRRRLHLDAGEDAESVEVALGAQQAAAVERLAGFEISERADDVGPGADEAAKHQPVDPRLRTFVDLQRHVDQRAVVIPVECGRNYGGAVALVLVERAHHVERLVQQERMERPAATQRQASADLVFAQCCDAGELQVDDTLSRALDDGDAQGEAAWLSRVGGLVEDDLVRPHLHLREAFEQVVRADRVEVGRQLLVDQASRAGLQPALAGRAEQAAQVLVRHRLVALQDDLLQQPAVARLDGDPPALDVAHLLARLLACHLA